MTAKVRRRAGRGPSRRAGSGPSWRSSTGWSRTRTSGSARTRPATSSPRSAPTTRPPTSSPRSPRPEEAKKQAEEADHKAKKKAREEAEKLKAKRGRPPGPLGEASPRPTASSIRAAVKADNPGLGRWKNMLEPLCLAALDEGRDAQGPSVRQKGLFPEDQRLISLMRKI